MKKYLALITVLALAVTAGLFLVEERPQNHKSGEVHSHALFYIVVNTTEKDFSGENFQLQAQDVHLENNESRIVHKHSAGVTWKEFLDTLNVSIEEGNETCVDVQGNSTCGPGEVYSTSSIDSEIEQGEKLVVAIGPSHGEIVEEYRKHQLPREYKPASMRGRRI